MSETLFKPVFVCIDDEFIILNSLQSQLQRNFGPDFQYEFAESGEEGLEIIAELSEEQTPIILIISDWLMPKMKGDDFLIEVHKKHPKIIKIMLTGQAESNAIKRAVDEADLFKCINKPWTEDDLINSIKEGLKKLGLKYKD